MFAAFCLQRRIGTDDLGSILPSAVPARANIAALKSLGVKVVVAFSAVGSLREEIRPGDFIVADQVRISPPISSDSF